MLYLVCSLFVIPIVCALLSMHKAFDDKQLSYLARLASVASFVVWLMLYFAVQEQQMLTVGLFYLDALSIWILLILSIMYMLVSFVSFDYLQRVSVDYVSNENYTRHYYALLHVFMAIMLTIPCLDNLGLMWVAIEATTLVSALLVAFKFTSLSVEAAWKYVMVCTVGICLALLGTILLYYAQINAATSSDLLALNWHWLVNNAVLLDTNTIKFAFLFIFVGYATKLGLAPMHTWLPDTYSLAPTPISGLLSGGLSTCVIYVIIKNIIIIKQCLPADFVNNFFLFFGVLSIVFAFPFLLVQREIKRMLAYSSIENMGILAIAIGAANQMATIGLLLHLLNHALIKFSLFYMAGRIISDFKTNNMMRIHGMMISSPRLARMLLFAAFGIAGFPPFGLFFSKLYIIQGLFVDGWNWLGICTLILLVGVFFGFFYHVIRMLSSSRTLHVKEQFNSFDSKVILVALLISICSTLLLISPYNSILMQASAIIGGELPR